MSIKEKPPDYFKSLKTSLKSILKHPEINTKKINDAVLKSNKIVIHTLQFLKLYLLHHYELHSSLPPVNHLLINTTMKILCDVKEDKRGRPKKEATAHMYETLTAFYQEHYQPTTQPDKLDYTYLNNVLEYLTEDIQTMYENNIQLHYVDYVERYVNVVWKQKYLTEKIRKLGKTKVEREQRIRKLYKTLRNIKEDLYGEKKRILFVITQCDMVKDIDTEERIPLKKRDIAEMVKYVETTLRTPKYGVAELMKSLDIVPVSARLGRVGLDRSTYFHRNLSV